MRSLRSACLSLVTALALLSTGSATAAAGTSLSVRILDAPPARTSAGDARFRFKVTPARARTWCKLDERPFRRCRGSVSYSGLRARRHAFVVRAKHGGRTTSVRRRWTVLPRAGQAPVAPATPAPAPQPAAGDASPTIGASAPPAVGEPVFSEDFNGPTIDPAVWDLYDGPGHAGSGLRRPSAFALDGQGNLVLTASMQNGTIVSGGVAHRVNYTYGRFVFRVRTEADPTGTMNGNILTWPKDQWSPEFTENDMYELGWHPNNTYRFNTFIHFGTQNWQHWFVHYVDPTQWHIIEMDWTADRLDIYRDGAYAWGTTDRPAIPDVPHHLCVQLDPIADRPLAGPVRMYVDWVRIYQ